MHNEIVYLTLDSLTEPVGRSQVLAYILALSERGQRISLHSFEKRAPDRALQSAVYNAGVTWFPHHFGSKGLVGGIGRVLRAASHIRGGGVVHARSDMAAAAAMLARIPIMLWDVRSFWADQRVALGTMGNDGPAYRLFKWVERTAARRSSAIVALTNAAIEELAFQYGDDMIRSKAYVVSTCADLDHFEVAPLPHSPPLRVLLVGTLNTYYDVPLMLMFFEELQALTPASLRILAPPTSPWDTYLRQRGHDPVFVAAEEMRSEIAKSHIGLSVCRHDAGRSLRAAMPTKLGEFLAVGRPVVVNAGLGDMDSIVSKYRCGAVISAPVREACGKAASEIVETVRSEDIETRCRAASEQHFDLDRGVAELSRLYDLLARGD